MKKLKKLIISALICVMACCCFLFAGCSNSKTYQFESLKYETNNTSVTVDIGDKFEGLTITEESYVLILNDDSTFVFRSNYTIKDGDEEVTEVEVITGTWMEGYEKEIYCTTEDGDTFIATKDGKRITVDYGEITIVLKK